MNQFEETILNNVATFTLADTRPDGTATWEVNYVNQTHRFTLDEWHGFGAPFCIWALNKQAALRHKTRHQIAAEAEL